MADLERRIRELEAEVARLRAVSAVRDTLGSGEANDPLVSRILSDRGLLASLPEVICLLDREHRIDPRREDRAGVRVLSLGAVAVRDRILQLDPIRPEAVGGLDDLSLGQRDLRSPMLEARAVEDDEVGGLHGADVAGLRRPEGRVDARRLSRELAVPEEKLGRLLVVEDAARALESCGVMPINSGVEQAR